MCRGVCMHACVGGGVCIACRGNVLFGPKGYI